MQGLTKFFISIYLLVILFFPSQIHKKYIKFDIFHCYRSILNNLD